MRSKKSQPNYSERTTIAKQKRRQAGRVRQPQGRQAPNAERPAREYKVRHQSVEGRVEANDIFFDTKNGIEEKASLSNIRMHQLLTQPRKHSEWNGRDAFCINVSGIECALCASMSLCVSSSTPLAPWRRVSFGLVSHPVVILESENRGLVDGGVAANQWR
ncbi:hypothetical protein CEXT_627741 [Caerostris extrusa]|uniref:Uncharacterized protein n=1 Tax=Caerostris extrusa TaxID=172846 RepID=A0AAV4XU64_CAEEX|nr:hypothetical protein CEXT_627741 [Caerostris extrusa]